MVLRNLSAYAGHSSSVSRDLMIGLRESHAELWDSHAELWDPQAELWDPQAELWDSRLGFQHLCVHIKDSTLGLGDRRATLRDLCLTPGDESLSAGNQSVEPGAPALESGAPWDGLYEWTVVVGGAGGVAGVVSSAFFLRPQRSYRPAVPIFFIRPPGSLVREENIRWHALYSPTTKPGCYSGLKQHHPSGNGEERSMWQ